MSDAAPDPPAARYHRAQQPVDQLPAKTHARHGCTAASAAIAHVAMPRTAGQAVSRILATYPYGIFLSPNEKLVGLIIFLVGLI